MKFVRVAEVFESIQGESTFAGLSCFFVRLAGCNLRCGYCDTKLAHVTGRKTDIGQLVKRAAASRAQIVEITGGEPLLQEGFPAFAAALRDGTGKKVLVETNGSVDISRIPAGVTGIVDVKTPGSGACGSFDLKNIRRLRKHDEVKFVICGRSDYVWAVKFLKDNGVAERCGTVLFSPATGQLDAGKLGSWMLRDGVRARLQMQLHKIMGIR